MKILVSACLLGENIHVLDAGELAENREESIR